MGQRADSLLRVARASTPTMLGLIGVVLLALPLRIAEGIIPTPYLPLVIVFYWSVYGPHYMPALSIFFIGLIQDLLFGGPLGLWPAVYLLTQYVVLSQRSYFLGREQRVVWIGFGFAAVTAGVMVWMIMSLMSNHLLPVRFLALQILATIAIYPLIAAGFSHLQRRVIVEA